VGCQLKRQANIAISTQTIMFILQAVQATWESESVGGRAAPGRLALSLGSCSSLQQHRPGQNCQFFGDVILELWIKCVVLQLFGDTIVSQKQKMIYEDIIAFVISANHATRHVITGGVKCTST